MVQIEKSKIITAIQNELQPKNLIPTLTAALITGTIAVSNTIAFGTMIFSGKMSAYTSAGIGLALFSGMVQAIIVSSLSSSPGMTAFTQSAIVPILALLVAQVAENMPITATVGDVYRTVIAALMFSTFITGIIYLIFGHFKLGKLIRFMPYPVFGGFLAGLGWLLVNNSFKVMVGLPSIMANLMTLIQPETLIRWLPGVFFAILLFFIQRKVKHYASMPITLLLGLAAFYITIWILNIPIADLMDRGWLLGPFPTESLWQPPNLSVITQANWGTIFGQTSTLVTLTFTSLIGILFNCSGVEIAVKADINLDKDLQVAGLANLITSIGGGIVGYQSAGLSILPQKIGSKSRLVGILAGVLFGFTLIFGASLLAILPKMVIGALLFFLGANLLYRWVIEARLVMPKYDYFMLLLILVVIATFGLLQGVFLGLIATIVLFAINYSRINVIRNKLTGSTYKSNVDRAPYHQQFLREKGQQLLILKLQGFIFFGTAFNLLSYVRERVENPALPALKYVVVDFRLVHGIDSSALDSLKRMRHLAEIHQFVILFTELDEPKIENLLLVGGVVEPDDSITKIFPDIDRAVEWCEDKSLYEEDITMIMQPSFRSLLSEYFDDPGDVDIFLSYMEKQQIPQNTVLIQQGDPPRGIYFLERGQVSVVLHLPNNENVRLRSMGEGTIVGELGFYLKQPATASVMTELPSTVYLLSFETLDEMEQKAPKVAAAFHKYMATTISGRLVQTNETVQALLD
jgi:SulP family sulfate permease